MVFADDHAQYVEIAGDGGVRMRRLNTGDGDRKRPTPGSKCLISFSVVPAEEQGDGGRVDKHVHETFVLGHPDVPLAIEVALQLMMQATLRTFSRPPFFIHIFTRATNMICSCLMRTCARQSFALPSTLPRARQEALPL